MQVRDVRKGLHCTIITLSTISVNHAMNSLPRRMIIYDGVELGFVNCTLWHLKSPRKSETSQPPLPQGYLEIMENLAEVAGLVPTQDWSVHAGGDSPFIHEIAGPDDGDGAVGVKGSLSALTEVGTRASTAIDGCRGPDNSISAVGTDGDNPSKSQHSVEMALFAEALAEISPDGDEDKGMLMLKEWLWSGPLLPCHYRVREFLTHGTAVDLGDAVREIQYVNTIYPGYVKV